MPGVIPSVSKSAKWEHCYHAILQMAKLKLREVK